VPSSVAKVTYSKIVEQTDTSKDSVFNAAMEAIRLMKQKQQ